MGVSSANLQIRRHDHDELSHYAKAGQGTGAASSLLKYYGTELNKIRYELLMAAGGTGALAWKGEEDVTLAKHWLRTKGNSIEGGTSEVQLNIIARRILGLPA